jgi:hypothetical protein
VHRPFGNVECRPRVLQPLRRKLLFASVGRSTFDPRGRGPTPRRRHRVATNKASCLEHSQCFASAKRFTLLATPPHLTWVVRFRTHTGPHRWPTLPAFVPCGAHRAPRVFKTPPTPRDRAGPQVRETLRSGSTRRASRAPISSTGSLGLRMKETASLRGGSSRAAVRGSRAQTRGKRARRRRYPTIFDESAADRGGGGGSRWSMGGESQSITSSASASSVGEISRPSVLAVLRLIASSNFVGACTGRSAVFSPRKIRSM